MIKTVLTIAATIVAVFLLQRFFEAYANCNRVGDVSVSCMVRVFRIEKTY